MKIIKNICMSVRNSLKDAKEYAKLAAEYKYQDQELADIYASIAENHLSAIDELHSVAVRYINDAKQSGKQVPFGMQDIWDWEHQNMIDEAASIRVLLNMYRG